MVITMIMVIMLPPTTEPLEDKGEQIVIFKFSISICVFTADIIDLLHSARQVYYGQKHGASHCQPYILRLG